MRACGHRLQIAMHASLQIRGEQEVSFVFMPVENNQVNIRQTSFHLVYSLGIILDVGVLLFDKKKGKIRAISASLFACLFLNAFSRVLAPLQG